MFSIELRTDCLGHFIIVSLNLIRSIFTDGSNKKRLVVLLFSCCFWTSEQYEPNHIELITSNLINRSIESEKQNQRNACYKRMWFNFEEILSRGHEDFFFNLIFLIDEQISFCFSFSRSVRYLFFICLLSFFEYLMTSGWKSVSSDTKISVFMTRFTIKKIIFSNGIDDNEMFFFVKKINVEFILIFDICSIKKILLLVMM